MRQFAQRGTNGTEKRPKHEQTYKIKRHVKYSEALIRPDDSADGGPSKLMAARSSRKPRVFTGFVLRFDSRSLNVLDSTRPNPNQKPPRSPLGLGLIYSAGGYCWVIYSRVKLWIDPAALSLGTPERI